MPPATTTSANPQKDQVVTQHRGLHPRSAHLVHGGGPGAQRQPAASAAATEAGGLTLTGGQDAAHDDFLHRVRGKPRAFSAPVMAAAPGSRPGAAKSP